jgi:hypothetical protein
MTCISDVLGTTSTFRVVARASLDQILSCKTDFSPILEETDRYRELQLLLIFPKARTYLDVCWLTGRFTARDDGWFVQLRDQVVLDLPVKSCKARYDSLMIFNQDFRAKQFNLLVEAVSRLIQAIYQIGESCLERSPGCLDVEFKYEQSPKFPQTSIQVVQKGKHSLD